MYIQIPLLVGFQILETRHFNLSVQAGPALSFLVSEKQISYENVEGVTSPFFDYLNESGHQDQTNWQIWGGVHLEYRTNETFSIFAEPTYKYFFKPVSTSQTMPVYAPWAIGVQFGIKYRFGYLNFKTMKHKYLLLVAVISHSSSSPGCRKGNDSRPQSQVNCGNRFHPRFRELCKADFLCRPGFG